MIDKHRGIGDEPVEFGRILNDGCVGASYAVKHAARSGAHESCRRCEGHLASGKTGAAVGQSVVKSMRLQGREAKVVCQ